MSHILKFQPLPFISRCHFCNQPRGDTWLLTADANTIRLCRTCIWLVSNIEDLITQKEHNAE